MSFDRLAPHYRWMERVLAGGLLQRCRTRWLGEVRNSRRVLLAGEGNGRMLLACAKAMPESEFVVIDQSREMLARARRTWQMAGRGQCITFERVDLRDWRAGGANFDLVITNFFLDCFAISELRQVVANLSAAALPKSRWLIADFAVPEHGWRRWRAEIGLAAAYSFFRCATGISANAILDPGPAMQAAGFELRARERFSCGLLYSDRWERNT